MRGRLRFIFFPLLVITLSFINTSCCSKYPSTSVAVVEAWLDAYEKQDSSAMVSYEQY